MSSSEHQMCCLTRKVSTKSKDGKTGNINDMTPIVTTAAKKSGDFAVLSQTDMMLLALTVSMQEEHKKQQEVAASTANASAPDPSQSQEVSSIDRPM